MELISTQFSSDRLDFQAMFEAAPSPYLILAPDFTIIAVNQAYLHATRRTRDDLVGLHMFDAFPDNPLESAPTGVTNLRASLMRVLRTKQPDTMAIQKYDIPVSGADGISFEERYWSPVNSPVFNAHGEVAYIIHHVADVTAFIKTQTHAAQMESEIFHQGLELQLANKRLREANEDLERRVAERTAALEQERLYLRSLLMAVPVPISVMLGPDHRYQLQNAAHQQMTAHREIAGKLFRDAFPEAVETVLPILDRIYETGEPYHAEREGIDLSDISPEQKDGHFALSWHPLFGANGKVEGVITATMDITAQLQTEAQLRRSEAHYRSLFDSIDEGFCVIEMIFDKHGQPVDYRFCEANPAFQQQTGLQDAVGKTMRELAPDHEQHWFDIYGKVAKTGEPIRFENEARALGSWYDVYAFRIDHLAGNQVAILFKNIMEQKRAEEALRLSRQQAQEAAYLAQAERHRLDAVLQAVPVGIVVSNAQGGIELSNAAHRELWGEPVRSTRSLDDFRHYKGWWADGSDRHGQPLQAHDWPTARILRGEAASHDTIEIESFDQPPVRRVLLVSGAPIQDNDGKIVGAVVAQKDVTVRVRAEEVLQQANRQKDEFLAMLAHELRNPLAPIAAAGDLLEYGRLDEARVKQTSAIISRQVRHMTGLVDDLLDISRVTRGLVALDQTRLDAKRIVADAVEQVRPLIEARRHGLTVHTPPESAFLLGDQKRLVQVLTNLLTNAAKYTPEGGNIHLDMEVVGNHVKMVVADNGIGMAPDLIERAFDLFTQAERTPDRAQGGLGIGLALVKSLVELHGGSITVESEGIGKGSRFTVCLPHVARSVDSAQPDHAWELATAPSRSLKVMIVDDNEDVAQMLAMLVETLGHEVVVEHSSELALARARLEKPQVCLLDIGLPNIDGNELARRLRAEPELKHSVLIAVTGYGQEHDRAHAREAGFNHHFVKPVDTNKLAQLLREIDRTVTVD
jgi:PAS domain S-box-containing protein